MSVSVPRPWHRMVSFGALSLQSFLFLFNGGVTGVKGSFGFGSFGFGSFGFGSFGFGSFDFGSLSESFGALFPRAAGERGLSPKLRRRLRMSQG